MLSRIRSRLTYANVMSTVGVFIALGGVSYAAVKLPKNSVGSSQIKKNAVTGSKVKNSSLTGSDVKNSSLTGSDVKNSSLTGSDVKNSSLSARDFGGALPAGARGPQGSPGAQGAPGPKGDPGPATGPAGGDLAGAYPNPQIADGAVGSAEIADGAVGAADRAATPVVSLFGDGTSVVAQNNTSPVVPFDGDEPVDVDNAGFHSYTQSPEAFRAPRDGIYAVSAQVGWEGNVTGSRLLYLRVDPLVGDNSLTTLDSEAPGTTIQTRQYGATVLRLSEGDVLRFRVRQLSGGPLSFRGRQASMSWISP